MDASIIIFLVVVSIYIPLAGILFYVWSKFGKNQTMVHVARILFLLGSLVLFGYMLLI